MSLADSSARWGRHFGGRLAAAALAASALPACSRDDAAEPDRPDVLFISLDTLAAGHLSLYGYGRPTSPRLEAFAEQALVFEDTLANAPWTLPSYASQFTGLYPGGLSRSDRTPGAFDPLSAYGVPDDLTTMAELFLANGYRTAAWVDNPWLSESTGLAQGFERFEAQREWRRGSPADSGLSTIAPQAAAWIEDDADARPFFAFVNCLDLHTPYAVDSFGGPVFEDPNGETPPGEIPVTRHRGMRGTAHTGVLPVPLPGGLNPRDGDLLDPSPIADLYDEGILRLDAILGDFLEGLDRRGRLDDALVIVSSDHGESLGLHGWYFLHLTLQEETVRVPLVLRLPRDRRVAGRVAAGVELVDLLPTLVKLCGLRDAPAELDGRSLVGHFDDAAEAPPERPRFSFSWEIEGAAVRLGDLKLIREDARRAEPQTAASLSPGLEFLDAAAPDLFAGEPNVRELLDRPDAIRALAPLLPGLYDALPGPTSRLFDVARDPFEQHDLAPAQPDRVAELERHLDARAAADAVRRSRYRPLPVSGPALDDAARAQLEELGYLDSDDG